MIEYANVALEIANSVPEFGDHVSCHLAQLEGENENYRFVYEFLSSPLMYEKELAQSQLGRKRLLKRIFDFVETAISEGDSNVRDLFCIEFVQAIDNSEPYFAQFWDLMGSKSRDCWNQQETWMLEHPELVTDRTKI